MGKHKHKSRGKSPRRVPISGSGVGEMTRLQFSSWRATTRQVCGLFPFTLTGGAPLVGSPQGRALDGSGAVCADPIAWFERGLITAPTCMVLGLNGLGKSSLIRRLILGCAARGIHTLSLGDIKGEYVPITRALGGQVIEIGYGKMGLNPMDDSGAREAATRIQGTAPALAQEILSAAHERKKMLVSSLIHISRRTPMSDREETVLDELIRQVEDHEQTSGQVTTLSSLMEALRNPSETVRAAAMDKGSLSRFEEITEDLQVSLLALISGRFGPIFNDAKTERVRMDTSVCYDVSQLLNAPDDLQASVLLSCWSAGFAAIEIGQSLADAGAIPRPKVQLVLDELWRILRAASSLVEKIDSLIRLNRTLAVGQIMITHSMSDLKALPNEADRLKAQGFVERSKMLFLGGLPRREMDYLTGVMEFSEKEIELLSSWNAPAPWDSSQGTLAAPVGLGKFLLKTSNSPGVPFQVDFVADEAELSDTSARWERTPIANK